MGGSKQSVPCCILYIHIYIVVGQVDHTPTVIPQRESNSCKSSFNSPEKSVPARRSRCSPPVRACSPNATCAHTSASSSHTSLRKPMFLNPSFFTFSKSYWGLHFSYGFCMPSTCCKTCGPTSLTKKRDVQFSYIFPTNLQCFVVVVVRRHATEATATPSRQS